ncbi:hypothetical protein IEQ34_003272 [Dendrobium chrysotoxum]|uniref:Aminotransferase class V domain-containing protein n=1 Tax=Dendrobium chrysotoxum TaxID=161865 RepID=A0AAV7H3B0_DENCH|nr:hypothetical protein IEQ34_003272 [Dendrobium chrysotoxum]
MFSRLATFRSKEAAAQKGKKLDHERFSSQNLSTEDDNSLNDGLYCSLKSMPAFRSTPEAYFDEPTLQCSNASCTSSPLSHRNSTLESIKSLSSDASQEGLTSSSRQSEEIIISPLVLLPYEEAEEQFLEDYESYFLHLAVDNVRKDQYPMLDMREFIYLDYATCPLYSRFQVEQHMKFLLDETEPFGLNYIVDQKFPLGSTYTDLLCHHILNILNTTLDDFSVVFTPGLVSCYRLFTEMYELQKRSLILVGLDHHGPVQHILESAAQCNVKVGGIPLKERDLSIHGNEMHKLLRKQGWSGQGSGLMIYSTQSLSTGMCHSMSWITSAQQNGWKVLLDVSCSLPMINIDLSTYQPEFVIGSLHHMLGYPSGLSFLLVRRSSHSISRKKGSRKLQFIEYPEIGKAVHVVTEGENLTAHTFAAMNFGFEHLESIGMVAIQRRVESLIAWLIKTLKSLRHKLFEKPLIQLYGSLDVKYRGSILAFNILDPTGNIFPARPVQQLALRSNIVLGCCSLIDAKNAKLLHVKSYWRMENGHLDLSLCNLEVLRLSLGPVSTFSDAYRLVMFISRFRDEKYMSIIAASYAEEIENEC